MIVIGVDVHKQSLTAVAVDEAGRMLDEKTVAVGSDELIGWAFALGAERLWALEDCRGLTRWLSGSCSRLVRSRCGCHRS
jgi:transposase